MPVHHTEIADIFYRLADLLDIEGENRYRVRAYRNAARVVRDHSQSMTHLLEGGKDLSELPGIGQDLDVIGKAGRPQIDLDPQGPEGAGTGIVLNESALGSFSLLIAVREMRENPYPVPVTEGIERRDDASESRL
jgi:hypothetical protein